MRTTCADCVWHECEVEIREDYEGPNRTYRHVCYRDSGSPQVRATGFTDTPPLACIDYSTEHAWSRR